MTKGQLALLVIAKNHIKVGEYDEGVGAIDALINAERAAGGAQPPQATNIQSASCFVCVYHGSSRCNECSLHWPDQFLSR